MTSSHHQDDTTRGTLAVNSAGQSHATGFRDHELSRTFEKCCTHYVEIDHRDRNSLRLENIRLEWLTMSREKLIGHFWNIFVRSVAAQISAPRTIDDLKRTLVQ
ncbi:hypothetical protein TNCV_2044591 [Trichonephila clavipes]|nr:hypothetical protein TNCV_2044591 [Trichonephila clavipes]